MSLKTVSNKVTDKFLHGKGIFTFLRSSVSSQIASWTDMGVCFVFFAWVFYPMGTDPLRSFLSKGCSVKAVAVKYLIIWGGSFILNLGGTTLLEQALQRLQFLSEIHWIKPDGLFAFARLSGSLVGSNFVMQKNFVYRPTRFDPVAIRIVDAVTLKKSNRTSSGNARPENKQNLNSK